VIRGDAILVATTLNRSPKGVAARDKGGCMKAFGLADEQASAATIEIPSPEAGPGEVLVRMRASSVNGYDVFVAAGHARGMMEHRYPVVVGKDFAGVIEAVGDGVTRFAIGDEVVGIAPQEPHLGRGTFAELVAVPSEGFIEARPAQLTFEQAASVGLAGTTALVVVETIAPSDGDVVLVAGATGGVGAYTVQLAAGRGATVVATVLPQDEDWIRGLGASEVADYSSDVVSTVRERHPEGVDGLAVAVSLGESFGPTAELVKDGGVLASTVGGADAEAFEDRNILAVNVIGQSDPATFARALRMAADGTLQVPITRSFGFDELSVALGLVGERRTRGKFAVTISS
jgi:NADPH:quinone reductase-like Zn-dependent oxidoreductase